VPFPPTTIVMGCSFTQVVVVLQSFPGPLLGLDSP